MKNKRGYTIIELLVALAIAAIIFASAGSGIVMGLRVFQGNSQFQRQAQLLVDIEEIISSRIRLVAEPVYLKDEPGKDISSGFHRITFNDQLGTEGYGRVFFDGKELFSEGFYHDALVFGTFTATAQNTAVDLAMQVVSPDGSTYTKSFLIALPNLKLFKDKDNTYSGISGDDDSLILLYKDPSFQLPAPGER